jgi:hypothetical protein
MGKQWVQYGRAAAASVMAAAFWLSSMFLHCLHTCLLQQMLSFEGLLFEIAMYYCCCLQDYSDDDWEQREEERKQQAAAAATQPSYGKGRGQ